MSDLSQLPVLAQSGSQNWATYAKVIIFLIAISFSVIGWVMKRLQERQVRKRAELEQQRRRDEMLRTGRADPMMPQAEPIIEQIPPTRKPSGPPPVLSMPTGSGGPGMEEEAKRRLRELAERRRRELEAMARGQRPPTSPSAAPSRPAPPVRPASPARPVAPPRPARSPQPSSRPAPQPSRSQPAPTLDQRRQRERDTRAQQEARAIERDDREDLARSRQREVDRARQNQRDLAEEQSQQAQALAQSGPVAAAARIDAAVARLPQAQGNPTLTEWRKAVILGEILRRPASAE